LSDLDFVLKVRGFSRAVSIAKSMTALAAGGRRDLRGDFFRSLFQSPFLTNLGSRFDSLQFPYRLIS